MYVLTSGHLPEKIEGKSQKYVLARLGGSLAHEKAPLTPESPGSGPPQPRPMPNARETWLRARQSFLQASRR